MDDLSIFFVFLNNLESSNPIGVCEWYLWNCTFFYENMRFTYVKCEVFHECFALSPYFHYIIHVFNRWL